MNVAVAPLPVGEGVAFDDVHLHIHGQQIIADVHAAVGSLLEEERAGYAFAHESAIEVGEDDEDRVYLTSFDPFPQVGES